MTFKTLISAIGFGCVLVLPGTAGAGVPTFDEYSHILRDLYDEGANKSPVAEEEPGEDRQSVTDALPAPGITAGAVAQLLNDIDMVRQKAAVAIEMALAKSEEQRLMAAANAEYWAEHAMEIRHLALMEVRDRLKSWQISEEERSRLERETARITDEMARTSEKLAELATSYSERSQIAVENAKADLTRLAKELESMWQRPTASPEEGDCFDAN